MTQQNNNLLDTIATFQEVIWAKKDISIIDEVFAKDVKIHSPLNTTVGADSLKAVMEHWLHALPDLKVTWLDIIVNGDKVISQWQAEGIHQNTFRDIPATHRVIKYTGCTIYKLSLSDKPSDKPMVTEYWAYVDLNNILNQMS